MDDILVAPTREVVDHWCYTFSIANYPLCKSLALELARRTSFEASADDYLFGRKSLVQSLHFLGEHDAAREIALETWEQADRFIETTMVHPRASMGLILSRIAALQGDLPLARSRADMALALTRESSPITHCQILALSQVPIAFWTGDEPAARAHVAELKRIAESNRFTYWIGWAHNLEVALELVFGAGDHEQSHRIDYQHLDGKQADHLATLDDRLFTDIAASRVETGLVGWSKIEVLRVQAVSTSWFDAEAATLLLKLARAVADETRVVIWNQRLDQAEAGIAQRLRSAPTRDREASRRSIR